MKRFGRYFIPVVLFLAFAALTGCVRRTMTITTEPPQALVFVNGQEIGRSEVSRDFVWYGDYEVTIRKEGYETLKTHWDIKPPWYQWPVFDFFAEVLWPGRLHDQHAAHYVLAERQVPSKDEILERAEDLRGRTLPLGP